MRCAWKELLAIIPSWMQQDVNRQGRESLQEIRMRIHSPPLLVHASEKRQLSRAVTREDLSHCINAASRYSPWTAASAAFGYITAPGGHRIGLCGEAVCQDGTPTAVKNLTSICIRVARDYPGIASGAGSIRGSILILGAPGWGKTTLLRDLCRQVGERETVCVSDERKELFPEGMDLGKGIDVLSGCPKAAALDMLLRTMGPSYLAVDEITAPEDCAALIRAANCGVKLLATAHGASMQDYYTRTVYRSLIENRVFDSVLLLRKDKSYTVERVNI